MGLCVASWDHLTTKGLVRVQPDLVSVWNHEQSAEAVEFHDTPRDRIVVTGAQPSCWFKRQPTSRAAFCAKVGLDPAKPFVLFVGSTASISAPGLRSGSCGAGLRRCVACLRLPTLACSSGLIPTTHSTGAIRI